MILSLFPKTATAIKFEKVVELKEGQQVEVSACTPKERGRECVRALLAQINTVFQEAFVEHEACSCLVTWVKGFLLTNKSMERKNNQCFCHNQIKNLKKGFSFLVLDYFSLLCSSYSHSFLSYAMCCCSH